MEALRITHEIAFPFIAVCSPVIIALSRRKVPHAYKKIVMVAGIRLAQAANAG
jgi:hypothetical protein